MKTISDQVMEELLQEEIAKLMFFIDRHNRWKLQVDSTEESRQHRLIADLIKEAADADHELLEQLKDKSRKS